MNEDNHSNDFKLSKLSQEFREERLKTMSDTPRTEVIARLLDDNRKHEAVKLILLLERELNDTKEQNQKYLTRIQMVEEYQINDQLRKELAEANAAHKEASEYAQCAYCQTRILKNPLHVLEHMEVCEKHPIRKAFAERDAALEALEEMQRKYGFTYCAFCGKSYEIDAPESVNAIAEHIKSCEKHPMRSAEAERNAWRKVADDLAASLYEIHGDDMNFNSTGCSALAAYEKLKAEYDNETQNKAG